MAARDWAASAGGEPGTGAGRDECHPRGPTQGDFFRATRSHGPKRAERLLRTANRIGTGADRLVAAAKPNPQATADLNDGCRVGPADCMRERRESTPGSDCGAAERDRSSAGARRRAISTDSAATHRKHGVGNGRRRAVVTLCVPCHLSPNRLPSTATPRSLRYQTRCWGAWLHAGRFGADGTPIRASARNNFDPARTGDFTEGGYSDWRFGPFMACVE